MSNKQELYVFIDEENKKHEFKIIDVFKVEESKYIALEPKDEEGIVFLKEGYDDNGNEVYESIIDKNELNEIRDLYLEIATKDE